MERVSFALLVSLVIMIASVVNQSRAETCTENGGFCTGCGERCRSTYGPLTQNKCEGIVCKCIFDCANPPPKMCDGGAGICSQSCPDDCCNSTCAQKYNGGTGFCNSLGNSMLCQCQYPC
ncbi:unnamed protein product [Cochlearia groenlandica]